MARLRRPISDEKLVQEKITMTHSQKRAIKKLAEIEQRSFSFMAAILIREALHFRQIATEKGEKTVTGFDDTDEPRHKSAQPKPGRVEGL